MSRYIHISEEYYGSEGVEKIELRLVITSGWGYSLERRRTVRIVILSAPAQAHPTP
jgi:hypothetical protein